MHLIRLAAATVTLACLTVPVCAAGKPGMPSVVKVVRDGDGYRLTRNGEPFFVKGVGGTGHFELLAKLGANSVRTWGTDNLDALLDDAHRHGLTVAVGIWLGHERHGFNYNDADQVAKQQEAVRQAILRYKSHPAVLLWGLGNEMEGYAKGDNAAIWSAINNLAALAKRLDPHHPTMTVVAEIGGDRVKNIHRLCPDIDIVGINSYAGAPTLPKRYREAGGTKPFLVTEFGPPGMWEVPKNAWGTCAEPTSTAKGELYRRSYEEGILGSQGLCVGSYAFLWGHKQEATATWFGMLLPDGSRLAAADALQTLWTGKPPAKPCPRIDSLKLDGPDQVEPGAVVRASLMTAGKALKVRWVLQGEPATYGTGGDQEEVPPLYPDALVKSDATHAEVRMPRGGGGYRLFAYVHDEDGGAAVANVPLFVKGPVLAPKAKTAILPIVLYDEGDRTKLPYVPTGWMGNTKGLKVDPECTDQPHAGKTCLRVSYHDKDGWAGVVWQSPANNWGDRPGGWDLTGAKKLTFWARGARGGEVVSFEFGLLGKDKKFPDTGKGKLDKAHLTQEWRQYTIDLASQDLTRIQTGFAVVIAGQGMPIEFFLDDIQYE